MTNRSKGTQLGEAKSAKSNRTFRMRGLSVRDVVLPWESKEQFKKLTRS
jgi:hypothetical protein